MYDHDPWRRGLMGRSPPGFSRFEELDDDRPLPRSMSFGDFGYGGNPYNKDSKSRAEYSLRETVPFDKSAAALWDALHFASKHCRSIRDHFERDVERSSIAAWASPKVVDALWRMNLEWNGVDPRDPKQKSSSPETVTYRNVVGKLLSALEDMKKSKRPPTEHLEAGGSKLSPQLLSMTLKKLHVTAQSIQELMYSTMKNRQLMESMIRNLTVAVSLLGDIEGLWRPSAKPVGSGKAQARWEDEEDGYVWPDYRGD